MINITSGSFDKPFLKNVSCMGRGITQGHETKILRFSNHRFSVINRIKMMFKSTFVFDKVYVRINKSYITRKHHFHF